MHKKIVIVIMIAITLTIKYNYLTFFTSVIICLLKKFTTITEGNYPICAVIPDSFCSQSAGLIIECGLNDQQFNLEELDSDSL